MRFHPRAVALAALIGLLMIAVPAYPVSCLIFPMACLKPKKKFGEEMEGRVLKMSSVRTEHYEVAPGSVQHQGLQTTKDWYVSFVVGKTHYVGERRDTLIQMAGYQPKPEEWLDRPVKLRFMDTKWMGIKGAGVLLKRPNGKEWQLTIVSIIGPDGIDECKGRLLCEPQAKIDREAREEAQLAKMGIAAPAVAAAPASAPQTEAAATTTTVAAAPATPAAPAEASGAAAAQPAEEAAPAAVPAEATTPAEEAAPAASPAAAETPPAEG